MTLAIILIDARHGVQVQTRRHSFIVSLLGIKHTLVAINKMDLVDFSEERFEEIKRDYLKFAGGLGLKDIHFAPISALKGDNVVNPSEHMPWYTGESLMETLESVEISGDANFDELRFPVQYVNRPHLNFRGYCGTLSAGIVRPGDEVTVLPSGKSSKVKSIVTFDGDPAGSLRADVRHPDAGRRDSTSPVATSSCTATRCRNPHRQVQCPPGVDVRTGAGTGQKLRDQAGPVPAPPVASAPSATVSTSIRWNRRRPPP